uniref:J domain-containing protein n=1 Tax=Chlamydomonas euryale TaxID=1486919 RepID=A0A7R9V9E1_9CHLO|mmetsp:Transcript_27296/g.80914  ORF Transcript_27296/g.80914 Transcript_27296/m.80914 type:complete len:219 (+) Transcript_27296:199-855(+)
MSGTAHPYNVLGLQPTASREQVKDAFRKLCLIYHPDKCSPELASTAEARFKNIKDAYDTILKGQAGYAPPPPGSRGSYHYTKAYYQAHGMDSGGPVKVGGPFGGYATEFEFYRAMYRTNRNNPAMLLMVGLFAIPVVTMVTSVLNGNTGFIRQFRDEGIYMFTQGRYRVNGRDTLMNPFSIRSLDNMEDSYIYKSDKYKHLRTNNSQSAPAQDGLLRD